MADNHKKNIDDLLMAYELGLLTNDEQRQFELRLLENDELMAEAGSFEEAIKLIKHDPDVRKAVIEADIEPDAAEDEKKSSRLKAFIPVFATAAVFLILLIIQPWEVQIRPSSEVVASGNRLAIKPFDNLVDSSDTQRLGRICGNLLISDLMESRYLQVISLKPITEDSALGHEAAMTMAQKAEAKWILNGAIVQEEPFLKIATELFDAASGRLVGRRMVAADNGEDVFALIDTLSSLIMEDLMLPEGARSDAVRSVAEITTHSQKAYFYYLEGVEQSARAYNQDAQISFKKVLEYDSTFAMAHYHLARILSGEEKHFHMEQAEKYSYKTGAKEKYLIAVQRAAVNRDLPRAIEWLHLASLRFPDDGAIYYELAVYYYYLYRYDEAAECAKKAIDIDPGFKLAYNQLAYACYYLGRVEEALEAIDRYIALAPDEANPYDSRGDICMDAGMLEEAIKAYEKALAIKPDFYKSMIYLEMLYIFKGDFERAEATVKNIYNSPSKYQRSAGRTLWAAISIRQGKFEEALRRLDFGITSDMQEQTGSYMETEIQFKYLARARIYLEIGDTAQAMAMGKEFVLVHDKYAPEHISRWRQYYAQILAECGRDDDAERVALELKADLDSIKQEPYPYYYAAGAIAFARGDYETALPFFEKLLTLNTDFYAVFMYARTLHESGRREAAIREYESLTNRYRYCWPLYMGVWGVKQYYYLGLACEEVGRREDAIKHYERFIDIWKNADRPVAELKDARDRLDRLKNI